MFKHLIFFPNDAYTMNETCFNAVCWYILWRIATEFFNLQKTIIELFDNKIM